jgi:hypothetical protein
LLGEQRPRQRIERNVRSREVRKVSDTVFQAHEYSPFDPPTSDDPRSPGLSRRGGEWWR